MSIQEKYELWTTSPYFDEETKKELLALAGDDQEIAERFYKDVEFGTAGMRGFIGAGTNRMNLYTVRKATQGFANFILSQGGAGRAVAIAYDSRRMSVEFATETATTMAANGIKAYVFDALRPTPELSFAVRELGCIAGVMITASHNPAEHNGYKVYWEDGAQIAEPNDKKVIQAVNDITSFDMVKTMSLEDAKAAGLYEVISKEIDDKYIDTLKKLLINPDVIKAMSDDLSIVYTPLHGTGKVMAERILKEIGFKNVYLVEEQAEPDSEFTTVSYPNPEDPKVFKLALELAEKVNADVVLATDPDADRLGLFAKDYATGEYKAFTGNMSGALICEYLLDQKREKGILSANGAIVDTVVTTNMTKAIAKEYNMKMIHTLTGFKYIGEQIKMFEETGCNTYEFGYEESYGCLIGTHARDKDAIVAVMSLCEAAAYYKQKGISLCEQMNNMYEKYGFYKETLDTKTLQGMEGAEQIKAIVEGMRNTTLTEVAGLKVVAMNDYGTSKRNVVATGKQEDINLPVSNFLYYELENEAWFCVRPSGTEPKIKYYFGVKGGNQADAEQLLEKLKEAVLAL